LITLYNLNEIKHLNILPTTQDRHLIERVEGFPKLDEPIKKNFPEILLATMTLFYRQYGYLRSLPAAARAAKDDHIKEIKAKAASLVSFSGMIQLRMPLDIHSRLLKMEVSMQS